MDAVPAARGAPIRSPFAGERETLNNGKVCRWNQARSASCRNQRRKISRGSVLGDYTKQEEKRSDKTTDG